MVTCDVELNGDAGVSGIRYQVNDAATDTQYSGVVPVKISGDMMPLSDFLNTFGLSEDDIKEYLK
mgnify:CR=1 FL=1